MTSELFKVPAFNYKCQARMLLSAHREELKAATTLDAIFDILISKEYASWLNYEIFKYIVESNDLYNGDEEFMYPQKLNDFIMKHRVSNLKKMIAIKKRVNEASSELVFKFRIDSTSRLTRFNNLRKAVAGIFALNSMTFCLINVNDCCNEATFRLPTLLAKFVFNEKRVLTEKQVRQFQALPISWLKCNESVFDFTDENIDV